MGTLLMLELIWVSIPIQLRGFDFMVLILMNKELEIWEEKEKGKLATKRLKELLKNADKVILKSHGVGKFGRCLGSLYLINDGEEERGDVSQILLAEGHGVEYFGGSRK